MRSVWNEAKIALRRAGTGTFAVLAVFIFALGAVGAFEPLEYVPQTVRDKLRSHDASGEIVIVAVDNQSLAVGDNWPWSRDKIADIITSLDKAGAETIAVDFDLHDETTETADNRLADAIASADARIVLRHQVAVDEQGKKTHFVPLPKFADHAELATSNVIISYDGYVHKAPIGVSVDGSLLPSIPSALAGVEAAEEGFFPIDYGLDLSSIPVVSAINVLDERWSETTVQGKTVLFAGTSRQVFPEFNILGSSRQPAPTIYALAAETLLAGKPVQLGTAIPFVLATFAGFIFIVGYDRTIARLSLVVCTAAVFLFPILLESQSIKMQIAPALLILAVSAVIRLYNRLKENVASKSLVDPISDLPNMAALKQKMFSAPGGVVALRILNFADMEYALGDRISEVYRALGATLGLQGTRDNVFHTGQGTLIAFYEGLAGEQLDQSVSGIQSLVRAVQVDGKMIDIIPAFGVDDDADACIYDRAQRSLMAAEAAIEEGGGIKRYRPQERNVKSSSLSMNSELEQAIENGQFFVVWQPKINIRNQLPEGGEVLARWKHPERGYIPADEFIKLAEKHDRVEKLTEFVLDQAIGFAAKAAAKVRFDQSVSANLSAKLLTRPNLPQAIMAILRRHDLAPERLILEVTETAAMATGDQALTILSELRRTGIRLSIDDYGTGLSTLEYLKKVPASEIKIDRTFVDAMESSRSDAIMVRSTIQLAHSLGRKVVAEGVERASTVEKLRQMDCDYVQGYHFGKPMKLDQAMDFLVAADRGLKAA